MKQGYITQIEGYSPCRTRSINRTMTAIKNFSLSISTAWLLELKFGSSNHPHPAEQKSHKKSHKVPAEQQRDFSSSSSFFIKNKGDKNEIFRNFSAWTNYCRLLQQQIQAESSQSSTYLCSYTMTEDEVLEESTAAGVLNMSYNPTAYIKNNAVTW